MILGTANFGNEYRGKKIEKEECFKLLEYFEKNGGKLIDTAGDYGYSKNIIEEYLINNNSKLKILYKLLFIDNVFNKILTEKYLEAIIWRGKILDIGYGKNGQSIYYPHELDPKSKITIIPDSNLFDLYLPIMKLHSKVYARSIFKIPMCSHADKKYIDDYIIGVDNMEQLKQNMDRYNV